MIPPCVLMYLVNENNQLRGYVRFFIYLIASFLIASVLQIDFIDDGLRHLSFAENKSIMISWGNVYPHSLFEKIGEFDPWGFWHGLLKYFIDVFSFEYAHIYVNFVSLFLLFIFVDSLFYVELKKYKNTIILLTVIGLTTIYGRYINLRPDLLSGFYIMSMYLVFKKENTWKKTFLFLVITLIYSPMYYLFFVYTIAFSAYLFMMNNYKNFIVVVASTLLGFLFYYFYYGHEYFDVIKYILEDEKLRDGLMVQEGQPLISYISLLGTKVLILVYSAIMIFLKIKYQKFLLKNQLLTLIIVLSLLWVGQLRYYSLFKPLFYVYFVSLIFNMDILKIKTLCKKIMYFSVSFYRGLQKNSKNVSFILIFSIFIIFEFSIDIKSKNTQDQISLKNDIKFCKNSMFDNKIILANFLNKYQYIFLYANPTVKLIPSCSIGWDNGNKEFKKLYKKFLQSSISPNELLQLIDLTNSDILLMKLPINNKGKFNINTLQKNKKIKLLFIYKDFLAFSVKKH